MHPPPTLSRTPPAERLRFLAVLLLYTLWLCFLGLRWKLLGGVFWDARVYQTAVHAFRAGANPYATHGFLNFVYPPLFLHAAAVLYAVFPARLIAVAYLALNCAALFAIPVILCRAYLRVQWLTPAVALAIFAWHPATTATFSFLSGNCSNLLYAVALLAGIPGLRRNRWTWFFVAVACGSMVKVTLLALLLLPLFLGSGQLAGILLTPLAVLAANLAQRLAWPAEYAAFNQAVAYQLLVLRDVGYGIPRYFYHILPHLPAFFANLVYPLHFLLVACLLLGLWRIRRNPARTMPEALWIATVLLAALLANPRLMIYDADLAILPAVLIAVEAVAALRARGANPLTLALPLALWTILIERSGVAALFAFLFACVLLILAGVYRSTTRERALDV